MRDPTHIYPPIPGRGDWRKLWAKQKEYHEISSTCSEDTAHKKTNSTPPPTRLPPSHQDRRTNEKDEAAERAAAMAAGRGTNEPQGLETTEQRQLTHDLRRDADHGVRSEHPQGAKPALRCRSARHEQGGRRPVADLKN